MRGSCIRVSPGGPLFGGPSFQPDSGLGLLWARHSEKPRIFSIHVGDAHGSGNIEVKLELTEK